MMSLPNNRSSHNQTNEMLSYYSEWMKYYEFRNQLFLALKIWYTLISILIIMGNTLVLLVTWRDRSLHQPNKYFVACLAVADLLVGTFIGPAIVYGLSVDYKSLRDISIHFCRFMVWIDNLAIIASVFTLTFISFDRYLKISKPLQYRSRMTTSKSFKIIFIIWFISTALATYAATPDSGANGILINAQFNCRADNTSSKEVALGISLSVILFLFIIVILTMYVRIFVVAHKRQKMLRNGELGETSSGQSQRSVLGQDLKIVRMLLIVAGVFCLCWLPRAIWNLLRNNYPNFLDSNNRSSSHRYPRIIFQSLVRLLALFNSLCNPIIYACVDQTYREAFKRLFKKMMCRTRSNTQQPPAVIVASNSEITKCVNVLADRFLFERKTLNLTSMNFIRAMNIILALSVDTLYINTTHDAIILVRACASLYQFWTYVYKKILSIFEQRQDWICSKVLSFEVKDL